MSCFRRCCPNSDKKNASPDKADSVVVAVANISVIGSAYESRESVTDSVIERKERERELKLNGSGNGSAIQGEESVGESDDVFQ